MCSSDLFGLDQALAKARIPFARSAVGDRYVLEMLKKRGWQLGGENSGHIVCLDQHTTGDGIVSALQVLAALRGADVTLPKAAAGVRLASRLFERFDELNVLLVGAGEMIEHCAAHFQARQPKRMVIANRSEQRRLALAQRWEAEDMPLADLPHRLHEFDIVISCTASTLPLIGLGAVKAALKQRRHRPVFMLDLAVPRDIEPQVKNLSDVFLYTVDDLAEVVQSGMDQRRQAYHHAESIIEEGVNHYQAWLAQRRQVPLIQEVHALSAQWHEQEFARALRSLEKGEAASQVLEQFSRALRQKMMHPYLQALSDTEPEQRELAEASLRRVFLSQR